MTDEIKPSKQKRRGRGEGALSQRSRTLKDGRQVHYWRASVRLADGTRREVQGKRKADVLAKLTEWQGRLAQGKPLESNAIVDQLMERFLELEAKPALRVGSYKAYERMATIHILPEFGRRKVVDLKPEMIQAFINRKTEAGLGAQTVGNIRTLLKQVLNAAVKWEILERNPAVFTKRPRIKKVQRARLTAEEAKRLLDICQTHRLGALYTLALVLGVRLSQLLGLRWSDIDMDKKTINLEVALVRIDGVFHLDEPKNDASVHVLPLPVQLIDVLKAHRDRQTFEAAAADGSWQDKWGLVFTTEMGAPIHRGVPLYQLQKYLLPAAKLGHMRFHDLRGSCATLLAVLGVHPRIAMEILGHADIRTTLMYYTSVLSDSQVDAMLSMAGLLWGTDS